MGFLQKHNQLKLDLLESLARSQKALARIIESMADISEASGKEKEKMAESMDAIYRYQKAVMEKLFLIRVSEIKVSPPSKPWTNPKLNVITDGNWKHTTKDVP